MATRAEIEAAAEDLSQDQRTELVSFLLGRFFPKEGAVSVGWHYGDPGLKQIEVEREFEQLKEEWKRETVFLSSMTRICTHPAYQRIIGLGVPAVRLILLDLQREPAFWFWALKAITGCDPVPESHRGHVAAMTSDWLGWGRSEGWLTP